MDTFEAIRLRRSSTKLIAPAPTEEELRVILEAAVLAPDHKELRPWRFLIAHGAAKTALSEALVNALLKREPSATEGQVEKERTKLSRAPMVIIVVTKCIETKIPFTELQAAVAAATQNLLLAATDLGFGTMWRTGDMAYDSNVKNWLGLDQRDCISGFIYIGTHPNDAPTPKSPDLEGLVRVIPDQ